MVDLVVLIGAFALLEEVLRVVDGGVGRWIEGGEEGDKVL